MISLSIFLVKVHEEVDEKREYQGYYCAFRWWDKEGNETGRNGIVELEDIRSH